MLVSYANLLRATLIGLLLTPVLIRALGETSFGVWSLLIGATGYIGLAEAGLSTALVAKVAGAEALGDRSSIAVLVKSGRMLLTVSAGLGSLIVLGLTASFDVLFNVPANLSVPASLGVLFVGASNVIGIIETSWSAAVVGIGRVDVTALIGLVLTTALALLQVVLAVIGSGIVGLASASLAIAIVSVAMNRRAMRRLFRDLPAANANWKTIKAIMGLGGRNFVVSISGLLAFGSDVVIVGAITGPNAAAAYAVASRAATFTRNLATSSSDVLTPSFGSAVARQDASRVRALYRSASFLGVCVAAPVALALSATAQPLLRLWTGTVLGGAGLTLTVLAALTVAQIPGHVALVALMGAQRSDLLLRYSLPSAIINVGFSVVLAMQVGVVGPALGSLLATFLVDPFLLRRMSRELLDLEGWSAFSELLSLALPPLLATLPFAVGGRYLSDRLPYAAAPLIAAAVGAIFALMTFAWLRFSGRGALVAPTVRQLPVIGRRLAYHLAPFTPAHGRPGASGVAD